MNDLFANKAFQIKNSTIAFNFFVLLTSDCNQISEQIRKLVDSMPVFFKNMSIVLDFNKLSPISDKLEVNKIISCFTSFDISIVGFTGVEHLNIEDFPKYPIFRTNDRYLKTNNDETVRSTSQVIKSQVRAGQQIYAECADLIVLANVNPGAQLLADGNIHVYGAMYGKAMAGVSGDTNAMIFCKYLDPELISIAGYYWLNEDIKRNKATDDICVYLKDKSLKCKKLLDLEDK